MDNGLAILFLVVGLLAGSTMGMLTWRLPLMVLSPPPQTERSPLLIYGCLVRIAATAKPRWRGMTTFPY